MQAPKTQRRPARSPRPKPVPEVEAFLADLQHPHLAELKALRTIILGSDSQIVEGIKWNAPSFRTTADFATFHLRAKKGLQLVLHRGAKRRADADTFAIADPDGLLNWRDRDRAIVTFMSLNEVTARKAALVDILRQWIRQV
ncbi:MAG: DUF1801 domain-containing protein [Anaerolineales bacterium]|nr:DUF1801 domain-containing protein [Anaerolineales bacterium]